MKRWVGMVPLILSVASPAGAGEILFANGTKLSGELANEVLMVSTGSDLIEVTPEQVGQLTPEEIHLRDGRIIRGAVVGGHVKVRTPLGEIAVRPDELRVFRADGFAIAPNVSELPGRTEPVAPTAPLAAPVGVVSAPGSSAPAPQAQPAVSQREGIEPTIAPETTSVDGSATVAAARPDGRLQLEPPELLEVVSDSALYRDAVRAANRVGSVVQGERVTFVDSIDRRLRLFNTVVLDGGYWIRVQATDGTVGWVPADSVREVR